MIKLGTSDMTKAYVGTTEVSKIYLGSELVYSAAPAPLPYDAQVEYLQSTGTQYINTGITPDSATGFTAMVHSSNSTDSYLIGLRNNNSNTRWGFGHVNTGYYYMYNVAGGTSDRLNEDPATLYLNYLNDKKAKIVGTNTKTINLPTLSFTPSYNIRLFGSAGVSASYTVWSGKIYYVKISQGSSVIMDLIPVRVGTVGYMYDKIGGNLLSNSGSGSFTLGNDIV